MKTRFIYIAALISTIILGLCSRKFATLLPDFVSLNFGDALWAVMIYFGLRVLFPQKTLLFSAVTALVFSYSIEFSQLYQAEWINSIRSTSLGALVLGRGFLTADLIRYFAGIFLVFCFDVYFLKRRIINRSFSPNRKAIGFKQYYKELNIFLSEQYYPDYCFIDEEAAKKYYDLKIVDYNEAWKLIEENGDCYLE
ncbi:MAG: DUF2809 domain-containing protein [Daejeonella sp.]